MKKVYAVFLFLTLLISCSSYIRSTMGGATTNSGFCDKKCGERCAVAGVKDRCLKYCGICCLECKCVPSGTYGHKDECPCYRDKKNSKGKPKCP